MASSTSARPSMPASSLSRNTTCLSCTRSSPTRWRKTGDQCPLEAMAEGRCVMPDFRNLNLDEAAAQRDRAFHENNRDGMRERLSRGSYEGPSVKRRARCDLQHGCLSSGFLFQASLGSGSASGVDGSERVGTGRAVWHAPNSYPGGRRQHRRSVPRSRLLCGHHVPEVGPILQSASFSPAPARSHTTRPSAGRVRPVWELGVSGSLAQAARAPVGTRPVLA